MVYYRKYRPQTIGDLDSTKVRETLTAVLGSKNIPHAFLFTGPKGLGKTSTARIIAKMVNCQNKKKESIEPCNTCDSCISITNGSNVDILEIDGASNRGIDEIRDLRDKVKLSPSSALKKVYIIDEVHMLTTEAFNALLKTIEEPPSHVMFIFATTEPQKVPATILSRCFHVAFPRATNEDIVHSLERIVDREGLKSKVDQGALQVVAKLSDGGFRDAAKMLEEIVAIAGDKKITQEFIMEHYKTIIAIDISEFLDDLVFKRTGNAFYKIRMVMEQGTSIKYFIEQILLELDKDLLRKIDIEKSPMRHADFTIEEIRKLTELFSKAYQDTKYAVVPQLPLELAVIAWCSESEKLKEEHEKLEDVVVDRPAVAVSATIKQGPTLDEVRKKEQTLKVRNIIAGSIKQEDSQEEEVKVDQGTLHHNMDELTQLMENIIYKVKPFNHSLAGVLRGCDIASFADGKLQLETAYKFHKERLQESKAREILEKVIKEITGKETKILIELKSS